MTSLSKMLSVLKLFSPDLLVIEVDAISNVLGLSRATAYRYVKALCDAGLLVKQDGGYSLGPRIIELDWMMRQYDPLIINGREVLSELSHKTGLAVFISVFFDGHIINTHIESPLQDFNFIFGRGRPMPLFRGAQSKVLVSYQKGRRLKKLYDDYIADSEEYQYSWKEFSRITRAIRKDGYCVTQDELNSGLTGLAAPIIKSEGEELVGSIAAVGPTESFELLRRETVVEYVIEAGQKIAAKMSAGSKVTE
ncbi:transcriptional regulator [Marinobacterium nitratireducens]|uniref:HTH-type transcriptional repressor AllR n=1 Tax=Marinobacterium nitratireducens TaxID=518897 RepID=A0A917ZLS4_9GAMM|nr:IclR family transcriptional regulator C-terminal domain-containing protein [Marinobacterium nitratireducens]GGO85420.1 transcriptional regulator [Marinobacterium nitratireducens]